MFKRRKQIQFHRRLLGLVWPRSGFRRAAAYVVLRIKRLPGSPHSIAAGFACGAAASFTPFIGLHFALAALVAWLMGVNVLASAIGTAVGNPWTFPFIWAWIYEFGVWILGADGARSTPDQPAFTELFTRLVRSALEFDFAGFMTNVWPFLWPMIVGSVPTVFIVWALFYWPMFGVVAKYQAVRRRRREKRLAARNDLTGATSDFGPSTGRKEES